MEDVNGKDQDPAYGIFVAESRGLFRGAAIQCIVSLVERNSLATSHKRFALSCLRNRNTDDAGEKAATEGTGQLRFSQSQLRLLRQEQLMLMAENERLVHELQEIRLNRAPGSFRPAMPRSVPEFKESRLSKAIDLTLSGERDRRYSAARVNLLCGIIAKLRLKVLGSVMRVLCKQPVRIPLNAGARGANSGHPRIRQITIACLIMESVVRNKLNRMKQVSFRMLKSATEGETVTFMETNKQMARPTLDARNLCLPGPHTSYHRQLPSVRRYLC